MSLRAEGAYSSRSRCPRSGQDFKQLSTLSTYRRNRRDLTPSLEFSSSAGVVNGESDSLGFTAPELATVDETRDSDLGYLSCAGTSVLSDGSNAQEVHEATSATKPHQIANRQTNSIVKHLSR